MVLEIVAANFVNYTDAAGGADRLSPEKSVFQISIGGNRSREGWHYVVNDGKCSFRRGLYTGEIFIDWNDEYKYKDKSKKQIKLETTPDYEISFRDGGSFYEYAEACASYVCADGRLPKCRGRKLSGSRCVPSEFEKLFAESTGLQSAAASSLNDPEKLKLAARMAMFALAQAFNILAKSDDHLFKTFASGVRRSYFFSVSGGGRDTWLTVQSGLCKVTANQGTRLPAFSGLEFANDAAAVEFVYRDHSGSRFDDAFLFKGAETYGSGIDEEAARSAFKDCCLKACEFIKGREI